MKLILKLYYKVDFLKLVINPGESAHSLENEVPEQQRNWQMQQLKTEVNNSLNNAHRLAVLRAACGVQIT